MDLARKHLREFTSFHPGQGGFIQLISKHLDFQKYPTYLIGQLRIKEQTRDDTKEAQG